jgi:hypothetical protein
MPGEIIRVEPFVDCGMTARAIWPLPQLARSQRPGNAEPIFERQCRVCLDLRPGGLGDFDGSLQNHHLCELASKTYAATTNQKAFALKSGIKLKTLMIETVSIIRESANQT